MSKQRAPTKPNLKYFILRNKTNDKTKCFIIYKFFYEYFGKVGSVF